MRTYRHTSYHSRGSLVDLAGVRDVFAQSPHTIHRQQVRQHEETDSQVEADRSQTMEERDHDDGGGGDDVRRDRQKVEE